MIPLDLPPADRAATEHSLRVEAAVCEALERAGGWLSFAHFMELVLYAPGLGYYSAGTAKFGTGGDFVTAPGLSPVFGRCVAAFVGSVLETLGGGDVVELGAGTGRLACDVLTELAGLGRLPGRYRILEVSADLRARQAEMIAGLPAQLAARVEWLDRLPEPGLRGIVLANEVVDALPVHCFRRAAKGVEELGVARERQQFGWAARPAAPALAEAVATIEADLGEALPRGYRSEWCAAAGPWIGELARSLSQGAILIVDYGLSRRDYYAPARDGGTLACFYRHRVHADPFVRVGLQDLSAWVDFSGLAGAGLEAGLELAGYTTQAQFLLSTGFDAALSDHLAGLSGLEREAALQAALTLVLPGEMGERFKCVALTRDVPVPRGFQGRDFSSRL